MSDEKHLKYAKEYYNDAPADVWDIPEVKRRVHNGKWGLYNENVFIWGEGGRPETS